MKKTLIALFVYFSAMLSAQSISKASFIESINVLNTTSSHQELSKIEKDFVKLINQNKDWYPYYYGALTYLKRAEIDLKSGAVAPNDSRVQNYLDTVIKFLTPIIDKEKNNAEVNALLGINYFLKFKYAKNGNGFKEMAKKYYIISKEIDANNPRVMMLGQLLDGQLKPTNGNATHQDSLEPVWGVGFLGKLVKKN